MTAINVVLPPEALDLLRRLRTGAKATNAQTLTLALYALERETTKGITDSNTLSDYGPEGAGVTIPEDGGTSLGGEQSPVGPAQVPSRLVASPAPSQATLEIPDETTPKSDDDGLDELLELFGSDDV